METRSFLDLFTAQRHDFLNHLQVVSGLIQLNKNDRVREYIRQISLETEMLGKILHLEIPEAAVSLLVCLNNAKNRQVEVIFEIDTRLENCLLPGPLLGQVLEAAFNGVMPLVTADSADQWVKLSIGRHNQDYSVRFSFSSPAVKDAVKLQSELEALQESLVSHGGRAGFAESGGDCELYVILPRGSSKQISSGGE